MTLIPWRFISYSSGVLIILLVLPVGLITLSPIALSGIGIAFTLLVGACIWSGTKANERPLTQHDTLVTSGSRQAKDADKSVLYEGNLGLYQKWYLEIRLVEEMARCKRYGLSMALIVVKLERTSALRLAADGWQDDASQAAYTTARSVRTVDLTAALGPREFAVCLVHCDREGAEIAQARFEKALEVYGPTSGLVVYPQEKVEGKQILRLARSRAEERSLRQTA